jgi:cyclophilin family peptidyl-prolyl cis-trans isomerase
MAELRRAQQRRRRLRVGAIAAVIIVIFIVLAYVTTRGGSKHKTNVATASTTATTSASASSTSTVAVGANGVPLGLKLRTPPPVSKSCTNSPTPTAATTTIPAKGNAVSIVPAPAGVGFPKPNGTSPRYTKFSSAPPFCIDVTKTYTATMVTDVGTITIHLYPKVAPVTVNSFVFLAGYHYFDGTVFHRVIPNFVDQGGDPTGTGEGGPGYTFADELPTSAAAYVNGSVAMANSGANTNGSQFFLVVNGGGKQLTPNYSVFGQITGGLGVANAINAGGSTSGTPTKIHKVLKVTITES